MKKFCSLLGFLPLALASCSYSYPISVAEDTEYQRVGTMGRGWLHDHRQEVVTTAVEYVRKQYPSTAAWFPGLAIGTVTLEDPHRDSRHASDISILEKDFAGIFNDVSARLVPRRKDGTRWQADVDVKFATPKTHPALYAIAVPYLALCWSNLLIVCPAKSSEYVILDARITTGNGERFQVRGIGGSTTLVSSPWAEDNNAVSREAASKAIAAAIADFAGKFIGEVEKRRALVGSSDAATQ